MARIVLRRALESSIERWVAAEARKLGVPSMKMGNRVDTQWPDRIFFLPRRRVLMIEFKRPGDDARTAQVDKHETLRALGYEVQVHDDRREALRAVRDALLSALRGD